MTPSKSSSASPAGFKHRKDRRFKQWNRTQIVVIKDPRHVDGQTPVEAFTYDISIGGARIHTMAPFDIGSLLRLQIELVRSGESMRVEGLVKWRKRDEASNVYEIGIEFQHTSMVTVLSLMKALHDGRKSPDSHKSEAAGLSRP
jgi:Tfp pilus assembly protein PilZ